MATSALVGSFGHTLFNELFFLSLSLLHVGALRTCARYASIRQSLDVEQVPIIAIYG
jgi:hypothetical protein